MQFYLHLPWYDKELGESSYGLASFMRVRRTDYVALMEETKRLLGKQRVKRKDNIKRI